MMNESAEAMAQSLMQDFDQRCLKANQAQEQHGISVHPRLPRPDLQPEPVRSQLIKLMQERKLL